MALNTSIEYGIVNVFNPETIMLDVEMQKVTVELPKDLLASVKASSGKGTTEVIRDALKMMRAKHAQMELMKLRGTLKTSLTVEEMRSWEDDGV